MGQTGGFAAGSWIVRQTARMLRIYTLPSGHLVHDFMHTILRNPETIGGSKRPPGNISTESTGTPLRPVACMYASMQGCIAQPYSLASRQPAPLNGFGPFFRDTLTPGIHQAVIPSCLLIG